MVTIIKGKVVSPYKLCLYGQGGVGKTTLATKALGALIFDFEVGSGEIDCNRTPHITSVKQLYAYVKECYQQGLFETAVFDSLDAMEMVIIRHVLKENNKESLADFAFGKGYQAVRLEWMKFLDMLDWLKSVGKNSICIGHEHIKKHDDPRMVEGYDKILLKLNDKSAGTVISRMDAVLYYCYQVNVVKGDKNAKAKALGKGQRVLHCTEMPAFVAKNRYGMPDQIKPEELFNYLPRK